jgi:hypothetical protein
LFVSYTNHLDLFVSPPRVTVDSVRKGEDNDASDELWDPRGYINDPPSAYMHQFCRHCKCPLSRCHDKVFGRYIELQIVNKIFESGSEPTYHEVQYSFGAKYNRALEQKISEVTGTLDTSTYDVPHCISSNSLNRLFRYIEARDYHDSMLKLITVGRGVSKMAQGTMFGSRTRK